MEWNGMNGRWVGHGWTLQYGFVDACSCVFYVGSKVRFRVAGLSIVSAIQMRKEPYYLFALGFPMFVFREVVR